MQLGLKHGERNPLEDTKRVVEQLRKNGTVDNLFSQALQQLFQSEVFKSEVRQYLQERGQPPKAKEAAVEHVRDMALSALTGLLAGTYSLQPQQQEAAAQAAGPARTQQQQQQQQQSQQGQGLRQQQQQQQQQRLGPGQKAPGQQHQQQSVAQRQLPANKQQPQQQQQQQQQQRLHQQQRQSQQQQKTSIHEEVSLKLQVALIQMLETEERYLQGQFKLHYQRHMQHLQDDRAFQLPDFTAEPPTDVRETPLSPTSRYNAPEFELEGSEQQQQQQQAGLPQQQHQQQHATQLGVGSQH